MSTPAPTLRRDSVPSALLDGERAVTVYLPPGYAPDGTHYPVLYMQDGQRLFDADVLHAPGTRQRADGGRLEDGSAAEESWRMGRTADAMIAAGVVEPLIIVGIAHAGPRRIEEYTPTATRRLGGGGAALYLRFLIEELMPAIDSAYATATGPSRTGIGGSSLGGLVSLYAGLYRPDAFGRLAVLSPSVWWDRRVILRDLHGRKPEPRPRIWLDMGTAEGQIGRAHV